MRSRLMTRHWTEREDATLARLYRAGAAVREIARAVARSEDAVNARRHALGLTARRTPPQWSPREDALLEAATRSGLSAPIVAERLGRPVGQVRRRRHALGLTSPASRPYGADDDAALRALIEEGGDLAELAARLGRTPDALRLRAANLGLHRPSRRRRWSPGEDAEIRDGYDDGLTCAEIAGRLTTRSAAGVAGRARQLGLDELARVLGRTPDALRQRARKLGLAQPTAGAGPRAGQPWTADENELLRLHPGLNPAALAELLGRSDRAVSIRLARLGLRAGRERSPHRRRQSAV
jgi:hypothetical protein